MSAERKSLGLLAMLARLTGNVFGHWKLLALVAFFVSPAGPHLRWEYQYRDVYGQRVFIDCTYLGARGFINPGLIEDCPFFVWLDTSKSKRNEP